MGFDVRKYAEERNGKTTAVPENKEQGFDVRKYAEQRRQHNQPDADTSVVSVWPSSGEVNRVAEWKKQLKQPKDDADNLVQRQDAEVNTDSTDYAKENLQAINYQLAAIRDARDYSAAAREKEKQLRAEKDRLEQQAKVGLYDEDISFIDRLQYMGQGIGYGYNATPDVLADTAVQAAKDAWNNRNNTVYHTAKDKLADVTNKINAIEYRIKNGFATQAEINSLAQLKTKQAQHQAVVDKYTTPLDMNTDSMQKMQRAMQYQQKMTEGLGAGKEFLWNTASSIVDNASMMPLAMMPGGQGAVLAAMGAKSAAMKAVEVGEKGGSAGEALLRGLSSGAIEAATEKMPLDNLVDILKGKAGRSIIKNALVQAFGEGTEETVSYLANLMVDKAARDPEAQFSINELMMSFLGGALSGGVMGGGATLANNIANPKSEQDAGAENVVKPAENVVETVEKETVTEEQAQQLEDTGITAETMEILQQVAEENGAELKVDLPENATETEQQTSDLAENNVPEMAEFEAVEETAETEEEQPVTDVTQEQPVENPVETVETVESAESVEERTEDAQTREILEQLANGEDGTATEPVTTEQDVPKPVNLQSVSSVLGELGVGEAGLKRAEKMFNAANGNAVDFAKEFVPIYNAGVKGEAVPEARGNAILSGAQRMLVYNSGRADAIKQVPNTAASDIMEAETKPQTTNTVTEENNGTENIPEVYDGGRILEPDTSGQSAGGLLDGIPAEDVRTDESEGDTVSDNRPDGRGTERPAGGTDEGRVSGGRSLGSSEGTDLQPSTGEITDEVNKYGREKTVSDTSYVGSQEKNGEQNTGRGKSRREVFEEKIFEILRKRRKLSPARENEHRGRQGIREDTASFEERAANAGLITFIDENGTSFAFKYTNEDNYKNNAKTAKSILEGWGVDVVIYDGELWYNRDGITGTSRDGTTNRDMGIIFVSNDTVIGGAEIAYHEALHLAKRKNKTLFDNVVNIIVDNSDFECAEFEEFINFLAELYDINGSELPEKVFERQILEEFYSWYVGALHTADKGIEYDYMQTFSDVDTTLSAIDEVYDRVLGKKHTTPDITEEKVSAPLAAETVEEQIEQKTELATQDNDKGHNFVYTEKGGVKIPTAPKARFKANVDAIKTLRNIKAENRRATPAEQEILAKYTGWGGVTQAFDEKSADWAKEYKQLKKLLTEEEYKTARGSILDAYYTENDIIRGMFKGLEKIGFKGGRLLEPSCGIGKFIGAMPQEMLGSIKSWSAVELDKVTGEIAKYLYPDADVRVQGFQDANLPDNYMDVVIGNVPFGSFGVTDKAFPPAVTKLIHNYFIAKSIRKARPGGIVCVITTKGTLDAAGTEARQQFMKEADLIGAIRLPNTAFKSTGTPVVSDILVFKKREANTPYKGEPFLNVQRVNAKDYSYYGDMNEYFVNHPEMVLGKAAMERGRYGVDITYTPLDSRYSLGVQIEHAFAKITAQMEYPAVQDQRELIREVKAATSKAKNGAIVHKDGKFFVNKGGVLEEHKVSKADADRLKGIIAVRDGARELLNLQLENADEDRIKESRAKLNKAYDSFVEKYGYLGHKNNQKLFNADTDKPFIISLENTDKNTGAVTKAEIFSKNTVTPIKVVTHADSVSEGLTVSLNEFGRIDVDRIAQLTGETAQTVVDELISNDLAYFDRNGNLETAEQYLSGNVRAKLKDAKALAEGDSRYNRNVAALEKIVPEDIAPEDIKVRLGATWVPDDIYSQFASEKLGTGKDYRGNWNISVKYNRQLGKFFVENHSPFLMYRPENTTEWGTNERPFVGNENNSLLVAALNNKQVTVYRKGPNDTRVVDRDATKAAQDKLAKLLTEFGEWLWKDDKRRAELGQMYNDIFNGVVTPKYDGSNLTIDGITPDPNRQMRPHQKNVVQRIINSGGNTLIAHRVGAGKTYEMSAAAMKLRQLGIVKKPVIIAPNHLVGQWGQEFLSYFPAAKILVVEKNDFSAANRKVFANKIATGDWDAVIMSYEQFEAVPMSEEAQQAFYQEQIDNLEMAIIEAKAAQGKDPSIRDMERSKRSFEEKLKKLAASSKKDKDNISFEELGIDALFVDEAHNFKNLFYTTKMNGVSDLGNKEGSARAFDLYSKVQYLQKLNGGRGIVFATATPVMNSAVEMYTMQRYLQADKLEAMGLSTFDAWANQFGDIVEIDKYKASGKGIETKRSLARYKNLAELQQMFRSFADVITDAADLPYLKIPKMKGGKRIVVECDAGEFQKSFMEELGQRAEALRGKGGKYTKGDDHIFKIMGEGKMISFSQKMINPDMPYEARGKIMSCVENVYSIWNATTKVTGSGKHKADKGTQLIFCDRGVPGGTDAERGVNIYADMKNLLVGMGVPAEEIAFIHDADTDAKKTELFKNVNDGKVRILIGSSSKMGTGMNAQKRIVAIHELNAPDRPGDLEQLEGRGLRQGNLNDEVAIYAYITKGTFDASQWDRLKRKGTFIHQIMAGEYSGREAEGDGEFAMEAAEIAAIASDNPLIMEHHQVSEKINTLSSLQRAHLKAVNEAKARIAQTEKDIILYKDLVEKYTADIAVRTDTSGDKFKVVVDGKTYTERKAAGEALIAKAKKLLKMADVTENNTLVGSFAGLSLYVTNKGNLLLKGQAQYRKAVNMDSAVGTVQSLEAAVKGIEKQLETANSMLDEAQKALPKLQKAAAAPFERAAELQELIVRENEIISILRPENERNQYVIDEEVTDEPEEHYSKTAGDGTDEWTATRSKGNKAEAKSLTEIIAKASHDLGIHVTTGHVRGKGVTGVYSRHNKGVRIRKTNDLPTVAHEFGHALDDRYGMIDSMPKSVKKELLDNYPDELKKEYPKKEHPFEALAEFVRQYLQNRDEAMVKYPEAAPYFLNTMSATDRAMVEQFADEVNAYYAAGAESAVDSVRRRGSKMPDFRTLREKLESKHNAFYQAWVDAFFAIKRFDRAIGSNVYRKAINAAYAQNTAANIIERNLTDINGKVIGPSLRAVLKGIDIDNKKSRELDYFGEYLIVRHGPERLAEGMNVFADPRQNNAAWMNSRQAQLEQQFPAFKEAAERLDKFIADFHKAWGVDTGIISQKKLDSWQQRWQYYVPLNRAFMENENTTGAKRGLANQRDPYKKAKGSTRDIINPIDSIVVNIATMVNIAERNNVVLALADAALEIGADASFIEKVPTPMVARHYDMTGLKQRLVDEAFEGFAGGKIDADSIDGVNELISGIDDMLTQYSRGKAFGDVITVLRNGEPEYWKVNDEGLLESLTTMAPLERNSFLKAYAAVNRFVTGTITGNNPVWSVFSNAPRDLVSVLVYGKNKNIAKLLGDMGISYANSFKKSMGIGTVNPLFEEYLAMGGGQTAVYAADPKLAKEVNRKLNDVNWKKRLVDVTHPIRTLFYWRDMIYWAGGATETAPRFATYKYLRENGFTSEEAFYEAMDVTVNFRRGGNTAKDINKVVPFFNAGVQGVDKLVRYYSAADVSPDKRNKVIRSRIVTGVTVSLCMATLSYIINNYDDEREKEYEQLSTYTKNNFFCIPFGDHKFFCIPKPRDLAVLMSLFERTFEKTIGNNEHAYDELWQYVADTSLPPIISDIASFPADWKKDGLGEAGETLGLGIVGSLGIAGTGIETILNRDFLGRPIVSQSLENLEGRQKYNSNVSRIAYEIGQFTNLSPLKIDHFGENTLSFWWNVHSSIFPYDASRQDLTLGVKSRYWKDSQYSTDLTNWMYDYRDKALVKKNSNPTDMDAAIKHKNADNMASFYSTYYGLAKTEKDTEEAAKTRQIVLDMILDYQNACDEEYVTASQNFVNGVVERTGKTDLMPSVLQTTVDPDEDNNEDTKQQLNAKEYVEYQTDYLRLYWNTIEAERATATTDREKELLIANAKKYAKKKAASNALAKKGIYKTEYTEDFGETNITDVVLYRTALTMTDETVGNDNDNYNQEEAATALRGMSGLTNETKAILWQSTNKQWKWQNNPWSADLPSEFK